MWVNEAGRWRGEQRELGREKETGQGLRGVLLSCLIHYEYRRRGTKREMVEEVLT